MTEIETETTTPPGLEDAYRRLEATLAGLRDKADRLHLPGGMSDDEKALLRRELGASDEASTRTRIRQELAMVEQRLELLEQRLPPEPEAAPPDRIAANAREEAARLRASRAYLAREVFAGNAARLPDLEECEARIRALELEAERAALVAAEYPS